MAVETLVSCEQTMALSIAERALAHTSSKTSAGAELDRLLAAEFMAGIRRAAARPLRLTIAWPDGVPAEVRATLRAQLQAELDFMAGGVVAAQAVEIPRTCAAAMRLVAHRSAAKG